MRLLNTFLHYSTLCALFQLPRSLNSQCKCDKGWKDGLPNHSTCYLIANETSIHTTWTDSKSYCNDKYNATLPMPKDKETNKHLQNICLDHSKQSRWKFALGVYAIGLQFNFAAFTPSANSYKLASTWVWEDRTPLSSMKYSWRYKEPYYSSEAGYNKVYAMIISAKKTWFIREESHRGYELVNVCQKNCSRSSPSTSTSTSTSTRTSTRTSTPLSSTSSGIPFSIVHSSAKPNIDSLDNKQIPQKDYNTGLIITAALLLVVALTAIFLYWHTDEKALSSSEANIRKLRPIENIEMMSSTGKPELDAIRTLDLFDGSIAGAPCDSALVPVSDQDAETTSYTEQTLKS